MIYDLNAKLRKETGKKVSALRSHGLIPGVIYGPEVKENIFVSLDFNELEKLYNQAGESSLINLTVEGEKEPREVLIKDVVFDPVKDILTHVDFYQIKRGQKLDIAAEIKFVGEAPAVKAHGGILIENLNSINIRCLPKDLLSEIEVDVSGLKEIDDKISIKDLNLPETVEIMGDLEETVVVVAPPARDEEDVKPVEAIPAEGEAKEGEKEDTKEGEAKEGEEKPADTKAKSEDKK